MSYELHLEKVDGIGLEEWKEAVDSTKNVRINEEDYVAVDPRTGSELRVCAAEGDAEVYFSTESEWIRILRFNHRISFKPTENWNEPEDELSKVIFILAEKLKAQVIGNEGEVYEQNI